MDLHLICPSGANPRLQQLLTRVLEGKRVQIYQRAKDLRDLQNKKLLFALGLDETPERWKISASRPRTCKQTWGGPIRRRRRI